MRTVGLIVVFAIACAGKKHKNGPVSDIKGAVGNVAGGAAKGAGDLAGGAVKGAFDVVTLRPVSAAVTVAGGAKAARRDAGIGAAKGAVKAAKGAGKIVRAVL
jgi:hypothetical protein